MFRSASIAQLWVCVLFLAIATGGWDTRLAATLLAGAITMTSLSLAAFPSQRRALTGGTIPWRALAAFGGVLAVGALQLAMHALDPVALDAPTEHLAPTGTWDSFATQVELSKLIGLGAAFAVGLVAGRRSSRFDHLLLTVVAAGLTYAGLSIALFAFTSQVPITASDDARLFGGLGSANVAASVLCIVIIVALRGVLRALAETSGANLSAYDRVRQLARRAPLSLPTLILAVAALLLTASRGGVAIAGASVLALSAWTQHSAQSPPSATGRRQGIRALIIMGGVLTALVLFGAQFLDRAQSRDLLADGRLDIFAAHLPAIASNPWLGHGMGTFQTVNETLMTADNETALRHIGALHSAPLQWLEEAGLIGTGAMMLTIALLFTSIVRASRLGRQTRSWNRVGVVLLAAVGLHSCFEYQLNVYAVSALCSLLFGAWWAYAQASLTDSIEREAEAPQHAP